MPKTAPPRTPDGRYLVVRGRLWRVSNPNLPEAQRVALVHALMDARCAVAGAERTGDDEALRVARRQVQAVKEGLGERGPVWWTDEVPDYNRRRVENTPYSDWYASLQTHDLSL